MGGKLKIHARLIGEIVTVTVIVIFAMVSLLPTASLFPAFPNCVTIITRKTAVTIDI